MSVLTVLVALLVSDQARITPNTIAALRADITALYAQANVQVEWTTAPSPEAVTVTLVRRLPPIPGCESALGCSVIDHSRRDGRVAFIAVEATWNYERHRPLLRGHLLAHVVAHELGHLIGLQHSRERGVMFRNTARTSRLSWTPQDRLALAQALNPAMQVAAAMPLTHGAPEVPTLTFSE